MKDELVNSYDKVATEYAKRIAGELADKPADRSYLADLAKMVGSLGPICDIGCGPGHVSKYLFEIGCQSVFGLDISPEMIREAKRLHPQVSFQVGNMSSLALPDSSLGGIVALYSIIHVESSEHQKCFQDFLRVLRPGGTILISFHIGNTTVHLEEWWGKSVSLDFHFLQTAEVQSDLLAAGFLIDRTIERDPYAPEIEHQSRRGYLFARKPNH